MTSCDHSVLADLRIFERVKILSDFGPTITGKIPDYPERLQATVERSEGDSVELYFTRLDCGHIGCVHPAAARSLEDKELAEFFDSIGRSEQHMSAQQQLEELLREARLGEDVDPAEVAALREQVTLETLAAEGAAELEALEREQAKAEQLAHIQQPINQELEESRENLDRLQNDAYKAITDLLDSVDEHNADVARYAEQLMLAGAETLHTQGMGRTQILNVGKTPHKYWRPQDWIAGLLDAAAQHHKGRWAAGDLPRVFPGSPRPTEQD